MLGRVAAQRRKPVITDKRLSRGKQGSRFRGLAPVSPRFHPWPGPGFSGGCCEMQGCRLIETSTGLWLTPQPSRVLRITFQDVKTVGIRNKLISKRYQHFRERDPPYCLQDSLCTLAPSCSRVTPLRHGTNTRYGRAANPYPTGTLTRQETPSFARHDNDQAHRRQWSAAELPYECSAMLEALFKIIAINFFDRIQ
jgi:hypothetical protein